MSDMIWVRGEKPAANVTLVSEGAREVVFERDGAKTTVASKDVRALRHGDTPGELDHALQRMEKGDFPAAERLLAGLEARGGWLAAHAGFHRANARRLRAELEGTGHDEALALLEAWREKNEDHHLAPLAALVAGDAALVAKDLDRARAEFERLAAFGDHVALPARLGLARAKLASSDTADEALHELGAIEKDAVAAADRDVVALARISRAAALGKKGSAKQGLDLLLPLLEGQGIVASPWHGAILNTIAELVADLAGRAEDGSAKPHARVAASYYVNRALRYATAQPVERARTLALAVEANTLSGREDIALMARTELGRRFPTSVYARGR